MDGAPGRLQTILLMAISATYFLATCNLDLNRYDEGGIAMGALRVLNGELPYRDFWTIYPPGQYYIVAFLYWLFGPGLLIGRIYMVLMHTVTTWAGYRIAYALAGNRAAMLSWGLLTVLLGPSDLYLYPSTPAVAVALLCCWFLYQYFESSKFRYLVYSAIAAGIVCILRIDFGVYLAVAATGGLFDRWRNKAIKPWILFVGVSGALVAPVFVWLLSVVGASTFYETFVEFPTKVYGQYRHLPYPFLFPTADEFAAYFSSGILSGTIIAGLIMVPRLLFYAPLLTIAALATVVATVELKEREADERADRCLLVMLLFFLVGLTNTARVRVDYEHVEAPMCVVVTVFPSLTSRWRRYKIASPAMILLVASVFFYGLPEKMRQLWTWTSETTTWSVLPRSKGIRIGSDESKAIEQAVQSFADIAPETEAIFIGNSQHRTIQLNDVVAYFLLARPPATKYHDMHPGVATRGDIQHEIVSEIKKRRVRHILLWGGGHSSEPNRSSVEGSSVLDKYIHTNFSKVKDLKFYSVWRAKA